MHKNPSPPITQQALKSSRPVGREQDDRYPGSYFRVPGVPIPGKTTWALIK